MATTANEDIKRSSPIAHPSRRTPAARTIATIPARTAAGEFGARASKLLEYLDQRHYGVKLSQEDFHRLTLWLDCNSEFYGSYENTEAQARDQVVQPSLH